MGDDLSASARLEMRGIKKSYGATRALAGVDMLVQPGEVMGLVGENGAGKSTLMKVLSGAIGADAGSMRLDGEAYEPAGSPGAARRAGVAMIYQELSIAPHLSVAENVVLGQAPGRWGMVNWRKTRSIARDALDQLNHDDIDVRQRAGELSVGKQQIVEIARAVAFGCRVLVLDEPTSSLNQNDIEQLFQLISRLREQGHGIIYISHFLEEIERITDRFTVLRDGESVGDGVTAEHTPDDIAKLMVGRDVSELYPHHDREADEVVLSIQGLSGVKKPTGVSLDLRRGEVVGIAGLVGAGRTELMRCVFGLDAVRAGAVRIVGHGVGKNELGVSPSQAWRAGAGMVSENRKDEGLALGLSIAENLTMSRLDGLGIGRGTVLPGKQRKKSVPWIERLAVKCEGPGQKIGALSGGNQQKVAIGRLLHAKADVWLLDEPTRGIDVGSKALIYELIDELAMKGKAVLMVSSYLPELMGMCDRIAVMSRGRLSEAKPVESWDAHALMLAMTGSEIMDGAGAT